MGSTFDPNCLQVSLSLYIVRVSDMADGFLAYAIAYSKWLLAYGMRTNRYAA